ncbi:hypothetical protein Taro_015053 [Colocasia esculenta]|uniref:CCHC-type domain-containing protein n=1 Tax=Colocasia esculenta TaxID=4460 RepID=A0A843UJV4_COLES|nr:hypothetical protein [Colocasia esculenta]
MERHKPIPQPFFPSYNRTSKHLGCLNTLRPNPRDEFRTCCGRVEELLVAEELWNDHKKLIFFPVASAATCTYSHLEVDQRNNIFCKGSVDTTILGVDTMVQNKGRNVKKSPSQVDTSPEQVDTTSSQVDTRDLFQGIVLPVWDSVSTHLKGRCNKPGHMKGECPENKKEKHKKIHKFKKPKAMVATWSDEDSSDEEEEEKSSSSESEEICFMANSSDGKVDTTLSSVDTLSPRSTLTSSSVDTDPLPDSINPWAPVKCLMFLQGRPDSRPPPGFRQAF